MVNPNAKICLSLAFLVFVFGPAPATGGSWEPSLSFEETRQLIGKGFAGKDESEPVTGWMSSRYSKSLDPKAKQELFTFFMSFPINDDRSKDHMFLGKKSVDGK